MANDSVTIYSEGKDKVGFTELMGILDANAPDALHSSETLRLRDDGETCEIKTHSGFSNFLSSSHKIQGETEAVKQLKKAIEVELGTGAGDRVFKAAGLENPNAVKGTEIAKLKEAFEGVQQAISVACLQKNTPTVLTWAEAGQSGEKTSQNKAAAQDLATLLKDKNVQWKVADSGSGGALLAFNADGTGAVVKIEALESGQKGQALSTLMTQTFATNNTCQVAQVETAGFQEKAESRSALEKKLKQLVKENDSNPGALKTLKKHQAAMAGKDAKDMGMLKMDFVAGTQVNKLPLEDKAALLHSGVLAKEIGKAAVLYPAVGLCDHVSPSKSSLYDDAHDVAGLPTNLSNLMIDNETGKISPIDFDTQKIDSGFGVPKACNGVLALRDFVTKAASSQQEFDGVLNRMAQDQESRINVKSPLSDALRSLTNPAAGEGLFSTKEAPTVERLLNDPEVLRKQAVSMLEGTLDGLENLKTNIDQFEQAFGMGNGMTPGDIQTLKTGLQGLDIGALRQNLNTFSVGAQVGLHADAADLEVPELDVDNLEPAPPDIGPDSVRNTWNTPAPKPRPDRLAGFVLGAKPASPAVNEMGGPPPVGESSSSNSLPRPVGRPVPPPRPARTPPPPSSFAPGRDVPIAPGNTNILRNQLAGQIQFVNPPPPAAEIPKAVQKPKGAGKKSIGGN